MTNSNKSRKEILDDLVKLLNSTDKPSAWLKSVICYELTKKTSRGRPKGERPNAEGSSYLRAKQVVNNVCDGKSRAVAIKIVSDHWNLPKNTIQKDLSRYEDRVFSDQSEAANNAEKHYLNRELNWFTYRYLNLKFKYKTDHEIKQAADNLAYEYMSNIINTQIDASGIQKEYEKLGVDYKNNFFEGSPHRSQLVAIGLTFFEGMERALYDSLLLEDK